MVRADSREQGRKGQKEGDRGQRKTLISAPRGGSGEAEEGLKQTRPRQAAGEKVEGSTAGTGLNLAGLRRLLGIAPKSDSLM